MKKLIAVAVLAAFSSLPYAAEKDITTDVVVVGQGAAGTAAAFAAAEQGDLPAGQVAGLQPVEEPVPVVLQVAVAPGRGAEDQQVVFVGFVGRSVGHVVYVGIRDAELFGDVLCDGLGRSGRAAVKNSGHSL